LSKKLYDGDDLRDRLFLQRNTGLHICSVRAADA